MIPSGAELAVESGRLVFLPLFRPILTPMKEFCLHLPCGDTPWIVFAEMTSVPKRKIQSIRLSTSDAPRSTELTLGKLATSCPTVFVGDPTFIYARRNRSTEGMRAFHASRRVAGGKYRTEDGSVAIAIRLGIRGGRIQVEQVGTDIMLLSAREEPSASRQRT